jgi:4-amino-4-deoxy-L-arabinose transferase-like glycosyltransferase
VIRTLHRIGRTPAPIQPNQELSSQGGARYHRRALVVLVVIAFLIRLAALASNTHPESLAGLSSPNGEMARNALVHGRWFVVNANAPTAELQRHQRRLVDPAVIDYTEADAHPRFVPYRIQMPGPALLLVGAWWLTGQYRYLLLQLLQVLLDALAVLLVYWISRRLYGMPRAALLAAVGYALFLPMARLMTIPFYDPWAVLATIAGFAFFLWSLDGPTPSLRLIAMGLTIGFGMWFRPAISVLPVAVGLALMPRLAWRRAVGYGLVPVLTALLVVSPYSLWTLRDRGQFTPVNVGFGQVLWEGLGERPNSFEAVLDDGVTFAQVQRERPELAYATPAYDSYLRRKALRAISEHPGYYVGLLGRRIVSASIPLWNWERLERIQASLEPTDGSSLAKTVVRHAPRLGTSLLAVTGGLLLFALAVVGMASTWRRAWRNHLLLLATATATFVMPVLLLVQWRYVAPATFVYLVLAGVACDRTLAVAARRMQARQSLGTGPPVSEPT